jgi:hypothetical protein
MYKPYTGNDVVDKDYLVYSGHEFADNSRCAV